MRPETPPEEYVQGSMNPFKGLMWFCAIAFLTAAVTMFLFGCDNPPKEQPLMIAFTPHTGFYAYQEFVKHEQ